jgi:hypothetical protein
MSDSAQRLRVAVRAKGSLKSRRQFAQRQQMYGSLRETAENSATTVSTGPILRITPPMQLEILRLYLQGQSLCEISRRTHRARQTVTKVCRSKEILDKFRELKERLLDTSDGWVVSIDRAVRSEADGQLAFRLLERFDVIPSLADTPGKGRTTWEQVRRQRL